LPRGPRAIIELAIKDYCGKLAAENPFPNAVEEQTMAMAAILRTCDALQLQIEDDETFEKGVLLVIFLIYFSRK
jgi:hypothetical protein